MHILNSVIAWMDLFLLSDSRSFSLRSGICCLVAALIYTAWIFVVYSVHGFWPYPFLNKLPHPAGILGTAFISLCVFAIVFSLGAAINKRLSAPSLGRKVKGKRA